MAIVLIVEDESFTREMAGIFIADQGHAVLFAGSVEEAVKILKSSAPIDVLFTDIYLKAAVFGGCDVARQGVSLRPGLRVLYTTGNSTTAALTDMFVAGSRFLGKPYGPNELQQSVDGILAA